MSSLRALEREATLAGFLLCDPCPMDLGSGHLYQLRNVTRSSGSEVELGRVSLSTWPVSLYARRRAAIF